MGFFENILQNAPVQGRSIIKDLTMMNAIFDSHAHYDDPAFDPDRDTLLSSMPSLGVGHIINAGASLESSRESLEIAARYPYVYAACGVHPEHAGALPADYLQQVEDMCRSSCKVRAVGEIGLDYHYDDMAPKETQREVFSKQIGLANRLGLPIIVHDREAHGDTMELLRRYRPAGVVHCFSGSVEMMWEVVALGMYIGLGGAVTFKNARVPVEVAKEVPLERLLLETDAPYMSPVPFRGKRCDSSLVRYTGEKIAQLKGISTSELFRITEANAARLFDIKLEEPILS